MKYLIFFLIILSAPQMMSAQNANQILLEQSHPEAAKDKRITGISKLDAFHTAVTYKDTSGSIREDLVYEKKGIYTIIASFKEIPSSDMPKNILESFKRNNRTPASKYFIVSPAKGNVNYFSIQTGKRRLYYSKMGHEMQPPH